MRKTLALLVLFLYCSCNYTAQEQTEKQYFDLKAYFNQEAIRLTKKLPTISKTISINGETEEKSIQIKNWVRELDSFSTNDLNKASWKGEFTISKSHQTTVYTSKNPKIPVKKLSITYQQNKIAAIQMVLSNTNALYTSTDSLSYYPDSLYEIKKTQKIKLMAEKIYNVSGKFN